MSANTSFIPLRKNGYKLMTGAEFSALGSKDPDTFYMLYDAEVVNIRFAGNGGVLGYTSRNYFIGGKYDELPSASRTGYSLSKWITNTSETVTVGSVVKSGVETITANWTANKYQIAFDFNLPPDVQLTNTPTYSTTATYGSDMPTGLVIPTVTASSHMVFSGYFDSRSGGTRYYNDDGSSARSWNKAAASSLYAQWMLNTVTITFDANGGAFADGSTSKTEELIKGENLNQTVASTGLGNKVSFLGWYDSNGSSPKSVSVAPNESSTVFARYGVNCNDFKLYGYNNAYTVSHLIPKSGTLMIDRDNLSEVVEGFENINDPDYPNVKDAYITGTYNRDIYLIQNGSARTVILTPEVFSSMFDMYIRVILEPEEMSLPVRYGVEDDRLLGNLVIDCGKYLTDIRSQISIPTNDRYVLARILGLAQDGTSEELGWYAGGHYYFRGIAVKRKHVAIRLVFDGPFKILTIRNGATTVETITLADYSDVYLNDHIPDLGSKFFGGMYTSSTFTKGSEILWWDNQPRVKIATDKDIIVYVRSLTHEQGSLDSTGTKIYLYDTAKSMPTGYTTEQEFSLIAIAGGSYAHFDAEALAEAGRCTITNDRLDAILKAGDGWCYEKAVEYSRENTVKNLISGKSVTFRVNG